MLELPDTLYNELLKAVTSNETILDFYSKINNKRRKIFSATINGTVISGHPTRTTFGNTLRVIMYYEYIF